jgi:dCMP deaminase
MNWHKRYIDLAKTAASWSKDPSRKIGAVIIGENNQIVSLGYNGFPRGINDTTERLNDRETKYKYTVHAEMNAIYNAIHNNASIVGCSIYVTGLPVCRECAKAIIQVGIKNVYMDTKPIDNWKESGEDSIEMFKEARINFFYIDEK